MKKDKKTENKKRIKLNKNIVAVTTFSLFALMVLVTLSGIVAFKLQVKESDMLETEEEYIEYEHYYAMITSDDYAEFWQDVYRGAKQQGELHGAYVELFAGDVGNRYSMQERMEIAIASDVDGIILEGEESLALKNEVQKAKEKGIPVVTVSRDMSESDRISFVGISRYDLGQTYGWQTCTLAEEILKQRQKAGVMPEGEKLQVTVLVNKEDDSAGQNLLMSGIREELAKDKALSGKMEVDTYSVDDSGAFTAEESIRDLFIGQEDVPDILVCLSEIYTSCAYQAVIDYNKVGITNIIGYYDSETILNAIEKEVIYSTISMDAEQMGRYCADALSEYRESGYVSEYYTVDTYVVNLSNVDDDVKGAE